jgi:hypothetical protein
MPKWKLFGKSKEKEEETQKPEEKKEEQEEIIETEVIHEDDEPLVEYHETLESDEYIAEKEKSSKSSPQRIWRDVDSIEKNVDSLHIRKATKPHTEVEKTVDKLIDKIKNVGQKPEKSKKPSNVVYVVSSPQPGEVRGDWAVKDHDKTYSHHKTKENAINEARKIAKKRDATVMVQNTDGTFSNGFKPR